MFYNISEYLGKNIFITKSKTLRTKWKHIWIFFSFSFYIAVLWNLWKMFTHTKMINLHKRINFFKKKYVMLYFIELALNVSIVNLQHLFDLHKCQHHKILKPLSLFLLQCFQFTLIGWTVYNKFWLWESYIKAENLSTLQSNQKKKKKIFLRTHKNVW